MTRPTRPIFSVSISAVLLTAGLCFFHCAEVAPPPGGAVDKTPPQILMSTPSNGSVNVTPAREIQIQFSERIVKPTTEEAVFVSPRTVEPPAIDWKSDRIVITMPDSFLMNQTYLVTVSTTLADLRNNRLDTALTIAFSTGPSLDSGRVSGYIADNKPVGGAIVQLYTDGTLHDSTDYDDIIPSYRTAANSDGYFSFSYLPPKDFQLLAFLDRNRDQFFSFDSERYGLADRVIRIGPDRDYVSLTVPLSATTGDSISIISAGVSKDRLVRVRLEDAIRLDALIENPAAARLSSVSDSADEYSCLGFAESDTTVAKSLRLWFGTLPAGPYNLILPLNPTMPAARYEGLEVADAVDNTPPLVERTSPTGRNILPASARPKIGFSEPLDTTRTTAETFSLWRDDSAKIPIIASWPDPFHVELTARLDMGREYTVRILEYDLFDLAGNALGDSLQSYAFSVVDSDSLGSISGNVSIRLSERSTDPIVLTFDRLSTDLTTNLTLYEGPFFIDLPAGKYALSAFIDSNQNGRRDDGSLWPFRLPETRSLYEDTVSVRSRFETAGIAFIIH